MGTTEKILSKRCKIDFSEHEVLITEQEGLLIHFLKNPNTSDRCIKFINTNGILAVTGDYGNYIFCREFHPSAEGYVSDGYWDEKLSIASTQDAKEFDREETEKEINELLNGGLEEYGYDEKQMEEAKEYFEECLNSIDDELDYTHFAYREFPSFMDYEQVVFVKRHKIWLQCVFDGFEEICRRMKEGFLKPIEEKP